MVGYYKPQIIRVLGQAIEANGQRLPGSNIQVAELPRLIGRNGQPLDDESLALVREGLQLLSALKSHSENSH